MMDLKLFCDESRENMEVPFNVDDYTYATNSHIIIRVAKDPIYDGNIGIDPANLPFDHDQMKEWFDLPPTPNPVKCSQCRGTGRVSNCEECEGEGVVTLNNYYHSYRMNCKSCDGEGVVDGNDSICPVCDGFKKLHLVISGVSLQGYRINLNLLEKIKTLPQPKLAFVPIPNENTYPPVRFKFSGGCGLLMPMRG